MNYYQIFSKIYELGAQHMCQDCRDFIEEGSKILDLGCGSGIAAKEFRDFFNAEVIGVDIKDNRLVDIPFQIIDGKNLPFERNFFDVILINYVLHHCQNPEQLLKEAKRVGEKIIIFEDLPEGVPSKLRCSLHKITFLGGKRRTIKFKTGKEWKNLFERLDLKVIAEENPSSSLDWLDPVKRALFVLGKK